MYCNDCIVINITLLTVLYSILGAVAAAEVISQFVFVDTSVGLEASNFVYTNGSILMYPTSEFAIQTINEYVCRTPLDYPECINYIHHVHTTGAGANLFLATLAPASLAAPIVSN
jgi:hypothetical protein